MFGIVLFSLAPLTVCVCVHMYMCGR